MQIVHLLPYELVAPQFLSMIIMSPYLEVSIACMAAGCISKYHRQPFPTAFRSFQYLCIDALGGKALHIANDAGQITNSIFTQNQFMNLFKTLCLLLLMMVPLISYAQDDDKMGSHVLLQAGSSGDIHKDGPYTYEKVEDITGVSKADLFSNVKSWIATSLKVSNDNIVYDQANDMITLNAGVPIKDFSIDITRQVVSFKLVFNFKDGKMRAKASDVMYYGLDGTGAIFQKPLNDLRPIRKKLQRQIYEQFDDNFKTLIKAAFESAKGKNADKW
jgi:hypothetical protein